MDCVLDVGAEDIKNNGDYFEVLCPVSNFAQVGVALEKAGIETEDSELAWIPNNLVTITDPEVAKKVVKLTEALDDLEDVQNVYSNDDLDGSLADE